VPLRQYQGKTLAVVWANLAPPLEGMFRSLYKLNDQAVSHACLFDVSTWGEKKDCVIIAVHENLWRGLIIPGRRVHRRVL
jgi:hypothetical protein